MGGTEGSHNARGRPTEGPWTMRQQEDRKDSGIHLKAGLASDLDEPPISFSDTFCREEAT